ncbi:MAG: hypothetical protein SF187_25245 [Deltaproteobacteria bacterium]|nr:hypothetical protein [Deltaproteobacteria bacterium]
MTICKGFFELLRPLVCGGWGLAMVACTSDDGLNLEREPLINEIFEREGAMSMSAMLGEGEPPLEHEEGIEDDNWSDIEDLDSLDRLVLPADLGLTSEAYLFHAAKPKQRLFIYHQGHDGNFIKGKDPIATLLSWGYDVLAFDMPLIGANKSPEPLEIEGIAISDHDDFVALERANLPIMRLFFAPILSGLDYVMERYEYKSVDMLGISGGGWTTHLYAAMDTRIRRSYPVAGAIPLDLRTRGSDVGDFEQRAARPLYDDVSYEEIFAMASLGNDDPERRQVQILNYDDPCCFWVHDREQEIRAYESRVRQALQKDGHSPDGFKVLFDTSHKMHFISPWTMEAISRDLPASDNDEDAAE